MFICPNCKTQTHRLIAAGKPTLVCPNCEVIASYSPAYLHNKSACGEYTKNMTEVQKRHIWQRTVSNDGGSVVMKSNPNRVWKW